MSSYKTSFLQRLIANVARRLERSNRVTVKKDSQIHRTVSLSGVRISGSVIIHEGCKLTPGVMLNAGATIEIGRYTSLNGPNMDIRSLVNPVRIGAFCSIARNVSIQEFNHNFSSLSTYHFHKNIFQTSRLHDVYSTGGIVIGNDVWIGTQTVILSGASIGNGAVIGANSVVNSEIPPYAIAVGSPAKVVGYRFSEEIRAKLEEIKWWEWPISKLRENQELFTGVLSIEKLNNIK